MRSNLTRRSLPLVLLLSHLVVLGCVGCSSKKGLGRDGYNQLVRSQQQAIQIEQMQHPAVYVRGPVQKPIVAWREGLTLAEALLDAGYTQTLSPRAIRVTRAGRVYPIDVRRLLRGTENPVLEPGDQIEVVR